MMQKFAKGSEWRKWDLHIHTPLSIQQNYGNTPEGWEKFISALENLPKEVAVIGITDYYFIDGYEKVMSYKQSGRLQNILKIFPVLEFRIDTFGSGNENKLQKINLHILFNLNEQDLKTEINLVRDEFIGNICLSSAEKHQMKKLSMDNLVKEGGDLQTGFTSFIPATKDVFKCINSDTWKNKTFLFLGYKEWSNLEKNQQLKPLKEELYDKAHAFLGSNFPTHAANQKWLNEFGKKVLLHSLDLHGFDSLDTFEFDAQSQPLTSRNYSCCTWIKADPSFEGLKQIIYEPELRVRVQQNLPEDKAGYQVIDRIEITNPLIFNTTIELNANLNSIIGGRSTGKSILLAAIAKKLKTEKPVELLPTEYDKYVGAIAQSIKIFWKDTKEEYNREIEFFQQGYMYDLARNEDKLSSLIQDILKLKGKEHALNSYSKNVSENKKVISELIENLHQVTTSIQQKQQKTTERGDKKGIEDEINRLNLELNKLSVTEITDVEKDLYSKVKGGLELAINKKTALQNEILKITSLKQVKLFKEIISFEVAALSDSNKKAVEEIFLGIKSSFEQKWAKDLDTVLELNNKEITDIDKEIKEAGENATYQKVLKAFSDSSQLSEFEQKIKVQKDKLFEITSLLEETEKLKSEKKDLIKNVKTAHHQYYELVNGIVSELTEEADGLKIKAVGKPNKESYNEVLLSALDQRSGENQVYLAENRAKPIEDETYELFDKLIDNRLSLKGGHTSQVLSSRLLSENYLKISYDLEYEGDTFVQMSDGKKAFVILKLLLDFSAKNCPILIDQPEDDLDNRAIYWDLVQYIKKKKQLRQIIVATHNPNIVVGADSEQVIVANQHASKSKNSSSKKFQYVTGSLEFSFKNDTIQEVLDSKGVREHVCEVLEGGVIAFKIREAKYGIE
jgi:predicted ATPase